MSAIRRLPSHLVNQIAAGEVVERPASALKELIENALDAAATRIEISLESGGIDHLSVADNGHGMDPASLRLALERHATSKLPGEDLSRISTLGFRGEALPSIASVARLTLASRPMPGEGWRITVDHGETVEDAPAAATPGTRVTVDGLFLRVPARRKFLKSPRAEAAACIDVVRRLAMARPEVAFRLESDGRLLLHLAPAATRAARLAAVLGDVFTANCAEVDHTRGALRLTGLAGLPTFHRAAPSEQYLFVGNRPVRDRALLGAIRGAYSGLIDPRRHAMAALFLDIPPADLDVNVHPAKTEVRFADPAAVRALVVGGLRRALDAASGTTATPIAAQTLTYFRPAISGTARAASIVAEARLAFAPPSAALFEHPATPQPAPEPTSEPASEPTSEHPLGTARAQLHRMWIVAETADGLILVDQHAAHERIVLERLRAARAETAPPTQALLLPYVVDLDPAAATRIAEAAPDLALAGLDLESFGPHAVVVRALPAALAHANVPALVRDIADELAQLGASGTVTDRLDHVLATIACHGAIRAGRTLDLAEMNALLRAMETTPHAGQCNHGRPTFVQLGNIEIARLFERS